MSAPLKRKKEREKIKNSFDVGDFETLPADTKLRTPHKQSPGGKTGSEGNGWGVWGQRSTIYLETAIWTIINHTNNGNIEEIFERGGADRVCTFPSA